MTENNLIGKLIDPPSGWMYGFPKVYNPNPGESLENWLQREGYPQPSIAFAVKYLRIISPLTPD